jgi:hypothetical protein
MRFDSARHTSPGLPAPCPRARPLALLPTILFLAAACDAPNGALPAPPSGWEGTTVEEGSTVTIRTTGGSVWGGEGRLIEELAIGTEIRGEDDLLGEVYGIEASEDRFFILDPILGTIRVYDETGNHVMDMGRRGQGPGEFGAVTALGIDPLRQQLVVRESQGVLHRFTLSGDFLGRTTFNSPVGFLGAGLLLRVTHEGSAIIYHSSYRDFARALEAGKAPVRTRLLYTVAPDGTLTDSLDLPISDEEPNIMRAWVNRGTYRPEPVPFAPQKVWSIGRDGALFLGVSDEYRFEIRYPDGRTTVIERDAEAVPVLAGEKAWATDRVWAIMSNFDPKWKWEGPGIPDIKAWYSGLVPDRSGRIWVLREGEGRRVEDWTEPDDWRGWEEDPAWVPDSWFDVFEEATGRYLGRVDVPEGFSPEPEPVIDGDRFICLTRDEFYRPIVRRYRLEVPA